MRLRAALAYAEKLGLAVFPVADDCRSPLTKHGVYDASKDPEVIRRWWARTPAANVAIACGAPSGVLVVDLDAKGEVDGFKSLRKLTNTYGDLPQTWLSATPSGGQHMWFRQPVGRDLHNKVGLRLYHEDGSRTVYPGIDIRTSGAQGERRGSAAAPPSAKPTGVYRWINRPSETPLADLPGWLLYLIDPPPPPKREAPPLRISSSDQAARYATSAVNNECQRLAAMGPNSGRNQRLFQAAANLGELVAAKILSQDIAERALEEAATDCGLMHEDGAHAVRQTIASGMRRGMANPRELQP